MLYKLAGNSYQEFATLVPAMGAGWKFKQP